VINYDAHTWRDHLFDIRGSMVKQIIYRVLACVLWSAGVVAFHKYVYPIAVPSTVHSLVGLALGLVLVFRTNASYDRFWEGRKQWGAIVNESRNLARMSQVLIEKQAPALHAELVKWAAMFPWATMHRLRSAVGIGPRTHGLPASELEDVLKAQHVPLAIAVKLTALIDRARREDIITDNLQVAMDLNVQQLIDYMGACERIHRTPLPFAYVVHLRRTLILYCFSLPFALIEPFGWVSVLDTFFVAYTFFGIEEIGVEIEDPFGEDDNDLPLEDICKNIEGNVLALITESPRTAA
jgi:ion channel-forming bestrophin family protein